MTKKLSSIGEIGAISRWVKGLPADRTVIKGAGDDAAVIEWNKDKVLLFACDILIEGTHFLSGKTSGYQIGWKALSRNISDIAAMGGIPRYALVSIGIDKGTQRRFADDIYRALRDLSRRYKINIVGGDTAQSRHLVIDISIIGQARKNELVLRSGAKEGDIIFVTGSLGGSLKGKHLNFTPRIEESRSLVSRFKVNSMIDISDGFSIDLRRVLDASNVGAEVYEGAIPVSKNATGIESALYDGEDFELLFTMSQSEASRFISSGYVGIKTKISAVGKITPRKSGYKLVGRDGSAKKMKAKGYLHF